MRIKDLAERYTNQQACLDYLESVRWGDYAGSVLIAGVQKWVGRRTAT